jgi:hypothetical protein
MFFIKKGCHWQPFLFAISCKRKLVKIGFEMKVFLVDFWLYNQATSNLLGVA